MIVLAFSTSLKVRPNESRIFRKDIPAGNIFVLLACREPFREGYPMFVTGWGKPAFATTKIKRAVLPCRKISSEPVSIQIRLPADKPACPPRYSPYTKILTAFSTTLFGFRNSRQGRPAWRFHIGPRRYSGILAGVPTD